MANAEFNPAITANATCIIGFPAPVQFGGYCNEYTNNWYFGDGNTTNSTEQNPLYVYETYGQFTIEHTCYNSTSEETVIDVDYLTVAPNGASCNMSGVVSGSSTSNNGMVSGIVIGSVVGGTVVILLLGVSARKKQ